MLSSMALAGADLGAQELGKDNFPVPLADLQIVRGSWETVQHLGEKRFALLPQVGKSTFGNPSYAALGSEELGGCDVVSPRLKYSLLAGKMLDWDRESRFPLAAEITEGLIISILDTIK